MVAESVDEVFQGTYSGDGPERYIPRIWHRLALLGLIYLTARYLDRIPGPTRLFDTLVALDALYTVAIRLLATRVAVKAWLVLAADLAFVLVLCHLTGGISSLVKYFGLAYFYLLLPYLAPPSMKAYLLTYSVLVTLLILPVFPVATRELAWEGARQAVMNLFVLNGAGWPSIILSGYILKIRKLQRETSLTFHSMNSAMHLRTQNLQAALDALTQAHEHLKQVDENKTRFLTNVSHELRTPLSSVRSFTEILLNYEDLDRDTEKEFLGIIHEETKRLNLLINDILDVVRLEAGKVELHLVKVDMAEVIRNSVKMMMPMAAEKGLRLEFAEPDGHLPHIKGDRNQMTQVMINLINNAVKFTSTGGIRITAGQEDERLLVSVADTGEGIYPEEREEIFKEFFRVADNVGDRPRGTGLGLPISRKILELHGGQIWAESEIGKGSVFSFTVPVDMGELAPEPGILLAGQAAEERRGRDTPLVLVVEQNSTIRQMLRKRLEDAGYKTLGAESGNTALKLATEWEPDCLVSSIHSFISKDVNIYTGLRTHPKTADAPVILTCLTSHPEYGLQVGVNGFVQRPVDRYGLAKAVDSCVQGWRGRVLVVSPDRLEARTVQLILGNHGYDVTLADESSWLEASHREVPSAVILDCSVPEWKRREIICALRQDGQTVRAAVILLTDAPVDDTRISQAVLSGRRYDQSAELIGPVFEALKRVTTPGPRVAA